MKREDSFVRGPMERFNWICILLISSELQLQNEKSDCEIPDS